MPLSAPGAVLVYVIYTLYIFFLMPGEPKSISLVVYINPEESLGFTDHSKTLAPLLYA